MHFNYGAVSPDAVRKSIMNRINLFQANPSNLVYRVPRGLMLGPLLFSLYVAPIEDIICARGLQSMIYADDTQMYLVIGRLDQPSCLSKLAFCAQVIGIGWWKITLKCVTPQRPKTFIFHLVTYCGNPDNWKWPWSRGHNWPLVNDIHSFEQSLQVFTFCPY